MYLYTHSPRRRAPSGPCIHRPVAVTAPLLHPSPSHAPHPITPQPPPPPPHRTTFRHITDNGEWLCSAWLHAAVVPKRPPNGHRTATQRRYCQCLRHVSGRTVSYRCHPRSTAPRSEAQPAELCGTDGQGRAESGRAGPS